MLGILDEMNHDEETDEGESWSNSGLGIGTHHHRRVGFVRETQAPEQAQQTGQGPPRIEAAANDREDGERGDSEAGDLGTAGDVAPA
jgi:hypothetical protein